MNLFGISDLARRWNYTRQGVHQKMQYGDEFLKPISVINNRTLVLSKDDIIVYEQKRKVANRRKLQALGYTRKI